jgi:TonB family protein
MKTLMTMIVITLTAFTARASDLKAYIAMPVGVGYAIDAKGLRHPNAFCVRDAVFAPFPGYIGDYAVVTRYIQGDGLYRLNIDVNTGRVRQVTIIKSTGLARLDTASTSAFKQWVFKPGKWTEITIPTTVRKKWVAMTAIPI